MNTILNEKDDINALTHKIIGCAMEVHKVLGNGFQEVIYQRALGIEFAYQGLSFGREMDMDLFYRAIGGFRLMRSLGLACIG